MVSKLPTSRLVSEQELVVWLGEGTGGVGSANAFFFFFYYLLPLHSSLLNFRCSHSGYK